MIMKDWGQPATYGHARIAGPVNDAIDATHDPTAPTPAPPAVDPEPAATDQVPAVAQGITRSCSSSLQPPSVAASMRTSFESVDPRMLARGS